MTMCCSAWRSPRCWILSGAALIYFILFPEDLERLLAPVRVVLKLTEAISPWAYALIAVAIVCLTIYRVWGRPLPPAGR